MLRVRAQERHRAIARHRGLPFDSLAAGHRRRRAAVHGRRARCAAGRYRPDWMSRRSRGRPGASVTCSTSNSPGVSSAGFAALGRNRVQVQPAVALPGKDQLGRRRPRKSAARCRARGTRCPDQRRLSTLPGRCPLAASATRRDHGTAVRCGPHSAAPGGVADECHLPAVGRPCRIRVAIHAGIQIAQRGRRDVVHADEGMVAALADPCQARAVRRDRRRSSAWPRAWINCAAFSAPSSGAAMICPPCTK